jgi:hypothetical protein
VRACAQWDAYVRAPARTTVRHYISKFGHMRNGRSELNYAVYDDRYQRTRTGGGSRSVDEVR